MRVQKNHGFVRSWCFLIQSACFQSKDVFVITSADLKQSRRVQLTVFIELSATAFLRYLVFWLRHLFEGGAL